MVLHAFLLDAACGYLPAVWYRREILGHACYVRRDCDPLCVALARQEPGQVHALQR